MIFQEFARCRDARDCWICGHDVRCLTWKARTIPKDPQVLLDAGLLRYLFRHDPQEAKIQVGSRAHPHNQTTPDATPWNKTGRVQRFSKKKRGTLLEETLRALECPHKSGNSLHTQKKKRSNTRERRMNSFSRELMDDGSDLSRERAQSLGPHRDHGENMTSRRSWEERRMLRI